MSKYGLISKLTASEGNLSSLTLILMEASKLVSETKGCHQYLVSHDPENPNDIWIMEVWDSLEDHDNSLKDENVKALIGKAMPFLGAPPEKIKELQVQGGFGLK